jgi:hypothetical protein
MRTTVVVNVVVICVDVVEVINVERDSVVTSGSCETDVIIAVVVAVDRVNVVVAEDVVTVAKDVSTAVAIAKERVVVV